MLLLKLVFAKLTRIALNYLKRCRLRFSASHGRGRIVFSNLSAADNWRRSLAFLTSKFSGFAGIWWSQNENRNFNFADCRALGQRWSPRPSPRYLTGLPVGAWRSHPRLHPRDGPQPILLQRLAPVARVAERLHVVEAQAPRIVPPLDRHDVVCVEVPLPATFARRNSSSTTSAGGTSTSARRQSRTTSGSHPHTLQRHSSHWKHSSRSFSWCAS